MLRQQVRAELPPGELAAIRVRAGSARAGQIGQHRPRVDLAVLEGDRHPRGAVEIGSVPLVVVLRNPLQVLLPLLERRLLTSAVHPAVRQLLAGRVHPLDPRRGIDGLPPPVLEPRAEVRREHLIRPPLLVEDPPRRDRVRRSRRHQRTLQRGFNLCVPRLSIRPVIRADVHAVRADLRGEGRDNVHRITPPYDEPAFERIGQAVQGRHQVLTPWVARAIPQARVHDEDPEHPAVTRGHGVEQRRVVAEPEIPPEPHHRCHVSHPSAVPTPIG